MSANPEFRLTVDNRLTDLRRRPTKTRPVRAWCVAFLVDGYSMI
jgi:hypothetical protein